MYVNRWEESRHIGAGSDVWNVPVLWFKRRRKIWKQWLQNVEDMENCKEDSNKWRQMFTKAKIHNGLCRQGMLGKVFKN